MTHVGASFDLVGDGNHLRIIVSKENPKTGCVLVCNITDENHYPDCPCKFAAGEHPQINKPTTIELRRLETLRVREFPIALKRGMIVFREDFSPELVKRITDAILGSKAAEKFKAYLR